MRIVTLFLIVLSFYSQAQTAESVIKKYIDFTGGEKNWKKVNTIESTGEYDYGGVAFPFTTYSKAPDLYKFVVPFNGKYYAQAFDGKSGWKIDAFKNETSPTLLEGKPALALANEADVELENPFINYKAKGHHVTLEGTEVIQNKKYFKVKLLRKVGEPETYYFDTIDYSLFMKTAVAKNVELENTLLNTYFSDYRKVDGLNFPFKTVHKANEQTVLTITVKDIKVNTSIEDKEFKP